MKTFLASLIFVTGTVVALAQFSVPGQDFQSAKIYQTVTPVFPTALISFFRNGGQARVEISVTKEGDLGQWLVTGYSHPDFAREAVDALKEWRFEPARWNGEPVAVNITLTFDFEVRGVVISSTVSEHMEARFYELLGDSAAYRPCTLRELDRIPLPIKSVSPVYPIELANLGVEGDVTVRFFINEEGVVLMPCVLGRPNPRLADLAVEAVSQWAFEPPLRKGTPVLVHAQQLFRFKPTTATADAP